MDKGDGRGKVLHKNPRAQIPASCSGKFLDSWNLHPRDLLLHPPSFFFLTSMYEYDDNDFYGAPPPAECRAHRSNILSLVLLNP